MEEAHEANSLKAWLPARKTNKEEDSEIWQMWRVLIVATGINFYDTVPFHLDGREILWRLNNLHAVYF